MGSRTSMNAPRLAALMLAALAICAAILGFAGALRRPPPDFASTYAAIRAVANNRLADVYDFATLAQLNAAHHYTGAVLYPYTYPPFTLLVLRPLALLPFDAARIVWTVIVYAALLGTALLLADAFARLVRRQDRYASGRLRTLLETTELSIGSRTFPLLSFAAATAALLLTLPLADAAYWGQAIVIVVFLLALALHAATRDSLWLAGAASGLIAGFAGLELIAGISVLACLTLLAFLSQGYWKTLVAGVGAMILAFLLALIAVPPDAYSSLLAQQSFLGGVYPTNGHNTSLNGLVANFLTVTEHTNTGALLQGERLAQTLGIVAAAVALIVAAVAALPRWRYARSGGIAPDAGASLWPLLALLLTVPMLAAPVAWPAEAMVTPLAALLLLGYVFARGGRTVWSLLGGVLALLALLLCIVAAISGSDAQNLPQGQPVLALYLLRPLAAPLVWAGALAVVAGNVMAELRGSRATPSTRGEPSPDTNAAARA